MASRPQYQINPEEQDIENLAESQANQGMGAGARQQLQNNSDRALATGANATLMGGGNANSISNLVDKSDNAYSQNSIYDDQVRLQNLDKLQTAYARMSADKDKQWDINNNQPWKDKTAANSQDLQYANGVINQGISSLGSAAAGAAKNMWGGGGSGGSGTGAAIGGAIAGALNKGNGGGNSGGFMQGQMRDKDGNMVNFVGDPNLIRQTSFGNYNYDSSPSTANDDNPPGQTPMNNNIQPNYMNSYWGG